MNVNIDKQNILDQGEGLFDTLFGNLIKKDIGEIEIRVFPTGSPEQDFFKDNRNALEKACEHCANGIDVYFGVNPRIGRKGGKVNVQYLTTFHAEVDYGEDGHKKASKHKNYQQTLIAIENFNPKPTALIHSGGGLHCYWVLNKPLKVEEIGIATLESVNKFFIQQLGGDMGTQDISRVLRVPGTFNFKLENNPRPVDVLYVDGPKYDGEELLKLLPDQEYVDNVTNDPVVVAPVVNNDNATDMVDVDALNVSPYIKKLIKDGNQNQYPSRSEADMAVTTSLVNACIPEKIIKNIFKQYQIGEKYREHNAPEKYLHHNIKKAKELSDLTDEEMQNPLFLSGAITKNKRKYHLYVVKFQELIARHYNLRYIEDGSCFVRYNGLCYEYLTDEKLNNLCQAELGEYRHLFSKNIFKDFLHFGIGGNFFESDKTSEDKIRYLTMKNGLYDLDNHELIQHTSDIFTTNLLPYNYDPQATCPQWLQFLDDIFLGDEGRLKIAQEAIGYSFLKDIPKPALFFLVGGGSNGKSKFISTIKNLVGEENTCSISLTSLSKESYLMSLKGKMINITGETPNSRQTNLDVVKAVVGGDQVTGKKLYKNPESFIPYAKHFLAMNKMPIIDDTSFGMERRIYIVEFLRRFEQSEMISDMEYRLKTELAGIFIWAIEGLDRLKENNFTFTTSESLDCAKNKYKKISNNVYDFIETCIRPVPSARTPWKDVFSCYQKFCDDLKYTQQPRKDLKAALDSGGYKVDSSTKDNNQVCVFGVELAE